MDTSGRVTRQLSMAVRPRRLPARASLLNWPYRVIILSLFIMVANGCTPTIQFGKPPLTNRLNMLTINVSTTQNVKAVLGEPQGKGAVRSPSFGVKEAWLYESTKVEGSKARLRMLMVFLDKERGVYHGHMWFASGMLFGQTK